MIQALAFHSTTFAAACKAADFAAATADAKLSLAGIYRWEGVVAHDGQALVL